MASVIGGDRDVNNLIPFPSTSIRNYSLKKRRKIDEIESFLRNKFISYSNFIALHLSDGESYYSNNPPYGAGGLY